ncbi:MAG: hypothetical protein CM15mP105_3090 [Methanobacteriota archaeon]|nr:MAG: hypothetical protein CM15mP105_3090 [Euryarchaeota archaeon]
MCYNHREESDVLGGIGTGNSETLAMSIGAHQLRLLSRAIAVQYRLTLELSIPARGE